MQTTALLTVTTIMYAPLGEQPAAWQSWSLQPLTCEPLCRLSTEHGDQGGAQYQPRSARAPPAAAAAARALQAVQTPLVDPTALRAVLHVERHAVDPVLHHQQYHHSVLLCGQLRRQLDLHDLHDIVRAAHLPSLLVPRQEGKPSTAGFEECITLPSVFILGFFIHSAVCLTTGP